MHISENFFYSCLSFLIGVVCISCNLRLFQSFIFIIILWIFLVYKKRARVLFLFCLLIIFYGGYFYYQLFIPTYDETFIAWYNDSSEKIIFTGKVIREIDKRFDHLKITVGVEEIEQGGDLLKVNGNVLVSVSHRPLVSYGDNVRIVCRLKKPKNFESFDYEAYLARYNVYSVCYYPQVEILSSGNGNYLYERIFKVKKILIGHIERQLPEPAASLVSAILIGARNGLSKEVNELFNHVGITHIIAISGYNISIIGLLFLRLFYYTGLNRYQAFWFIILCIIIFVIFSGASASVIRAGIMGCLVLFARHLGRPSSIKNILVLTVCLMTLCNPKILMFDIGFQLSFIATVSLIYLPKYFENSLGWLPNTFEIRESFIATFTATIGTLPLTLLYFKKFSLYSIIVNILIVPLIPLIMVLGTFLFIPYCGAIFAWMNYWLIEYILYVSSIFARLPFAYVDVSISLTIIIVFIFTLLLFLKYIYYKKTK